MSQTAENIRLPESPYAIQLREGFGGLRFARALEREFRDEFSIHHLPRLRAGFGIVVLIYVLFGIVRWKVETGSMQEWGLVLRLIVIGSMSITLVATYFERLRFILPLFAVLSYATFAIAATAIEAMLYQLKIHQHYEGLILVSFHLYVFSGLLFRPALVAGASIFMIYVIGSLMGGLSGKEGWGYQLFFIGVTQVTGIVALYSIERLERDSFLRRGLFGTLATQDGLTGLFNRMAFFQQFERRIRQAARERVCIGVMVLDVDHFKAFNDGYGHLEGDVCLRAVAGALRNEFKRPLDLVARYGGEEFVGYWHDIQPQSLRSMTDQVRAAVQALRIAHRAAPGGRLTASVGAVALVPNEEESLTDLVQRADEALYEAKEQGRNRVVTLLLPSAAAPTSRGRRAPTITKEG
ncbi:MAG: diguanylate cyclase domain-containing protein [Gammaproteobacteria bacterium]